MKSVLVVSNTGDIHTDYLVNACNRLGAACFRLNTDRFRISGDINWDIIRNNGILKIDEHYCSIADIDLLIYRRPEPVHQLRRDIEPWLGKLLDFEWMAIENSLSNAVTCIVMNPIEGATLAQNKIIQMQLAKQLGMNVPETLISTDVKSLKEFSHLRETITKGIVNSYIVSQGVLRSAPTRKIRADEFENYNTQGCPTLVQQAIQPKAIWRIVTIGEKTLGFRFFGSELLEKTDSRDIDQTLQGEFVPVPDDLRIKLIKMCQKLSICFASSDIIEDNEGRIWFLDLNPEGQWAFLEDKFNVRISDEIINISSSNIKT